MVCGSVKVTVCQVLADKEHVEQQLEALRRDLGVRLDREYRGMTEWVLKIKALEQAIRTTEQVATSNRRSFKAGSRINAERGG